MMKYIGLVTDLLVQDEHIKQNVLRIELDSFNNQLGLEMGLAIIDLANKRNQNVAVQVERLNHTIFLYFMNENLSADKHHWLRRKANVSKHFEQSSLSVKG